MAAPSTISPKLKYLGAALALWSILLVSASQQAQAQESCAIVSSSETDVVFNQAFSTIQKLTDEALKAKRRGRWRPNGSFAKPFLRQAGKSLRRIRSLLNSVSAGSTQGCGNAVLSSCSSTAAPKADLMRAFDAIFSFDFPRGLTQLKRFKRSERRKFSLAIDSLPQTVVSCQ